MSGSACPVSVVIPAHDAADYLGESLASVESQTVLPAEIIVVDDGSTDGTARFLDRAREKWDCGATRLEVIHQSRAGTSAARNAGIEQSSEALVAFLDADDRWHPQKLERHLAALDKRPEVDATYSWYRSIDASGQATGWIGRPCARDFKDLLREGDISTGQVVARRDALQAAGGFDTELTSHVDLDLWLRMLARRPGCFRCIPEILLDYRRRPGQISANWQRMSYNWDRVIEKARSLQPDIMREIEREAHTWHLLYLSKLAYRAGDIRDGRRLLSAAWANAPLAVARRSQGWSTTAAVTLSSLPRPIRDPLFGAIRRYQKRRAKTGESQASSLRHSPRPDMLKIAFLLDRFPVPSETFIVNEIAGAIMRGHLVTILVLSAPPPAGPIHPDVVRLGMLDRAIYLGLPRRPDRWAAKLTQVLWQSRRNVRSLPGLYGHHKPGNGVPRGKFMHQALRLLGLDRFDIIHCQFGSTGLVGHHFRSCSALRGKLVTTFRGFDISRHVDSHGPDVYADLFATGDHFLVNCDFFRQRLVEIGCDPARLSVQHSSVDTSKFTFRPRIAPSDGRVVIATVARLVEKKGIADALHALGNLIEDYPGIDYRILGDGPLRIELETLTETLGIASKVTFLGAGNQDDVIGLLDTAHLFVGPSVTATDGDQDGPINTLKEAMAMGIPVIATRHGGIPELVSDGVTGRLIPERNPEALADEIRSMLASATDWERMGRVGRAVIESEWDREPMNDQLDTLYCKLARSGTDNGGHSPSISNEHPATPPERHSA